MLTSDMRGLSLRRPYAHWVADGHKPIETRTRRTNYRGDILICSSQSPRIGLYGHALCIVELYDVIAMTREHEQQACVALYDGAYARMLRNLRPLPEPFPVKGSLGLWKLNDDIQSKLAAMFVG